MKYKIRVTNRDTNVSARTMVCDNKEAMLTAMSFVHRAFTEEKYIIRLYEITEREVNYRVENE